MITLNNLKNLCDEFYRKKIFSNATRYIRAGIHRQMVYANVCTLYLAVHDVSRIHTFYIGIFTFIHFLVFLRRT